jgi:hypothetical protein
MAHVHDAHGHDSTTTVVSDREGPATALIALIVIAALALLVWFFAFSGVVFDRDTGTGGGTTTNIEDNSTNTDSDTTTNTDPGTVPDTTSTGG